MLASFGRKLGGKDALRPAFSRKPQSSDWARFGRKLDGKIGHHFLMQTEESNVNADGTLLTIKDLQSLLQISTVASLYAFTQNRLR